MNNYDDDEPPLQLSDIVRAALACLALACVCLAPVFNTGCAAGAPPSARVVQVQTLKAVGHSAEAAITLTANLYAAKQITDTQAREVMTFYDRTFQPAFRVAVAAVNANLESLAPADLQSLANQLNNLVASLAKPR